MSQEQLAKKASLDQSSISDFERGAVAEPSFEFVYRLAVGLGTSVEHIFFGHPTHPRLDPDAIEFAVAFQKLTPVQRARWMVQLLMASNAIGDKEIEERYLKGKLPPLVELSAQQEPAPYVKSKPRSAKKSKHG